MLLSKPKKISRSTRSNPALIVSNGISRAKLRDMLCTGRDLCFSHRFGVQCYQYDSKERHRALSIAQGIAVFIKLTELIDLNHGIYARGTIEHTGQGTCSGYFFGGVRSDLRSSKGVSLLREDVEVELIYRGVMVEGLILSLHDAATDTVCLPYLPKTLLSDLQLEDSYDGILSDTAHSLWTKLALVPEECEEPAPSPVILAASPAAMAASPATVAAGPAVVVS